MVGVVFNWDSEYEAFMKSRFPKNEGLYKGLNDNQERAIKNYFKWRTKTKFDEMCKDNTLRISEAKAKELSHLTGGATDWVFDGIVDLGEKSGRCTLGHPLRYEHYAYSPSTRRRILFGSKCVSDFFEVAPAMIRQMDAVRKETFEDIRKTLYVFYAMKGAEYKKLNYDKFPQPMMQDKMVNDTLTKRFGTGADILIDILKAGLPVPQYFIQIIRSFEIDYNRNKIIYDRLNGLDGELYNYALKTVTSPDYFKPNKHCHDVIGKSIMTGNIMKYGADGLQEIIRTGCTIYGNTQYVMKAVELKDYIKQYRKVFLVSDKGEIRPAYKNEIDKEVIGLKSVYMCALPNKEWEAVCSLIWSSKGKEPELRAAYPKARTNNFGESSIETFKNLMEKMLYGIEFIKNNNVEEWIEKQKEYVDDIVRLNNTENFEVEEIVLDPKLLRAWDYLQNNKSRISIQGILDMLNRYTDLTKLSEKQVSWIIKVYDKLVEFEDKNKTKEKESKPKAVLDDKRETTQMFIMFDENNKRCAIINSNDVCRPMKARKFLPCSQSELLEMFGFLDTSKASRIVCSDKYTYDIVEKNLLFNYERHIREAMQENENIKYVKPSLLKVDSVIGDSSVESVRGDLGFSDIELRKYAMSIFEEEGVIDKFLKDATAVFLRYRKEIKQSI